MGDINVFLKKLYYIHTVCDDARKEKKTEDANAKQDNFTKKKKEVAMQIREVKAAIKERDELVANSGSRADQGRMSAAIRAQMRVLNQDIEILQKLQQKYAKKYEGKENVKPEVQVKLDRQKEVVELAFANLERVTDMERYGPAGNPARDELLGGTGEGSEEDKTAAAYIPDLDDDDFKQMKAMDEEIDKDLEEILQGLSMIKGIALEAQEELARQGELMDDLEHKVDKTRETLVGLNQRLGTLLKKTRKPRDCCCDICLVVIILAIAAAIVFLVTS